MAKRPAENLQSNSKKIRLTTVDDSFWDDDVDDDCFNEIASKILEQDEVDSTKCSQGDNSILPSYDSFRPGIPFASTQSNNCTPIFLKPKNPNENTNKEIFEELKLKVTCLQQKCEAKEGEVTILRTQIQKLKSEMIEDQSKKHREYLEKTSLKEKEIKRIKGELEFKNLEIANLKQKISDISKVNLNKTNQSESNKRPRIEDAPMFVQSPKDNRKKTNNFKDLEKDIENNVLEELVLPLRSKFPIDLFENIEPEIHVVETRINQYGRNTIPYLHNQIAQEEFTIPPGPKITVIIDNKEVGLEYVYPDILKIIQCDIEEIDSKEMQPAINKILGVSIQLLEFFKQYLEMLEKSYRSEDIDQVDKTFVQSNFDSNMNCEIGVRAGKTVQFVAEVLPYSSYLVDYVIFSKMLKIDENSLRLMRNGQERNYLSLLNDIVKKIYYLKKTEVCYTFLNAVGTLLLNISKENLYGNVFSIFNSITGLLLFTKPPVDVLHKILVIFKNCSKSRQFVNFLCQKPESKKYTTDKKRKVLHFTEESCKFSFFVALLNNSLQDIQKKEIFLDFASNILSFTYNMFMMNPFWLHNNQRDQCTCLEQLYQTTIEIVYRNFLLFKDNQLRSDRDFFISIFKCGIKIFDLMNFNSYDLMEKYVESYSKYREICNFLSELQDDHNLMEGISDLQKLSLFEEIPCLQSAKLDLL